MANIYQLWDNTVLNSANATPEQLEQKRNELKLRFENTARKNGATSKDIYATLDRFDQCSKLILVVIIGIGGNSGLPIYW